MAYNKFITKNGTTLLDITDSTVTVDKLTKGTVAYDKGGHRLVGKLEQALQAKEVTENSEVTADEGYYGLSKVTVNIPDPKLQDKEVTPTTNEQLITADEDNYGLSSVKVDAIQTEEKTVTANGDVIPQDGKYFSKVTVDVQPKLSYEIYTPDKTGKTIKPSDDAYGLSEVVVNPIPDTYMEVPTEELTINSNNSYDVLNYAKVNVNVVAPEFKLQEKTVTPTEAPINVTPDSGYNGLSKVTINPTPLEEYREVTPSKDSTKIVTPDSGYLGLKKVAVNPIPSEYIIPSGTVSITENGTHSVLNYDSATVDVKPALQSKEVTPSTSEQTITADADKYGLSSVKVKAVQVEEKTATTNNSSVTPTSGKYLSKVNVNLPMQAKTIAPATTAQTVTSDASYQGLSSVTVSAIPNNYIIPSNTKTIITNGTHDVSTYAEASVNVQPALQEKTATPTKASQNITVDSGFYGLSKVTVNPIPDNFITPTGTVTITSNGTHDVTAYASASVDVQPTLQAKEIDPSTSAQTVTPDAGTYGLSSVKVNAIQTEEKTVTANGSITPTSGKYLSKVTVNVQPTLQEKTVTPTKSVQTITADSGNYGLSKVTVDPISDEYIKPEGSTSITTNGTYDVTTLASASVNVQPVLQEKTATANGVIKPDSGYAGLSKVTVAVPAPKVVYSTGEPSDTTALWIKTNTNITSTKFTTSPPEKLTYNIGTLADTQRNAAAVAIGSGSSAKIWLLGGSNGSKYIDTIKMFDPATETITTITDDSITGLNMPRMSAAAYGNTIYFFGGYVQESSTEIHTFNTSTNILTTLSTVLPEAINSPTVVAYGSKIYIFGGKNSSGTPINSITVFDTTNNTATKLSVTLPSSGAYTNMAAVSANSKIYLFGGLKADGTRTAKINVFNPSAKTIVTSSAVLPSPADSITATVASSNIYLFGGDTGENALNTINTFDITKEEVATMKLKLPYKQSGIAAATSGTICYLFGGGWNNTYYDTISRFTTVPTLDTNCALIELDYTKNSAHSLIPQIEAGIKSAYIKAGLTTSTWSVYQYINDAWVNVTTN